MAGYSLDRFKKAQASDYAAVRVIGAGADAVDFALISESKAGDIIITQDYIMRLIKQVIRALIGLLLNKKTTLIYEMPANSQQTSGDDLLTRLLRLADSGAICEAENELLAAMQGGSGETCLMALYFYEHINEYSADFLEEHNFSREEIKEGVLLVAEMMGRAPYAATLLDECQNML